MNKTKVQLSVVLAVRNEEENLGRCLASVVKIADEIVIADEKSTDNTVSIARKFGAKILSVPHQDNFHISKNLAIAAATKDWILQLDADEVVSPALAYEIKRTIGSKDAKDGYWVRRKNWFLDRFLTKGGQYPDPTLRLYRKGYGELPAKDVHEQAVVKGSVGQLENDLLHYRDTSFEKYLSGFNRYSSFIADQLTAQKESLNILSGLNYLAAKPVVTFLKIYLRHRGYVDGFAGFVFALFSGFIYPVAYIKHWQHTYYPK